MFTYARTHFALTCLWYYSPRQLNLFLAWRYNLGILKGAQGPPAFMLECLVRNAVLWEGSVKKKRPCPLYYCYRAHNVFLVHIVYICVHEKLIVLPLILSFASTYRG